MRLAWLTDLHLNFVTWERADALAEEIVASSADAVLISGDVGEADTAFVYLERLGELTGKPIHFVLGNHDYYFGSITAVRRLAARLSTRPTGPRWLPAAGIVSLTEATGLVGHDGWGDAGFGNALASLIQLNDFNLIEELKQFDQRLLVRVLNHLGQEAAAHFRSVLPPALEQHNHVIALMHVPPFRQAAWHDGREMDDDWLPYYTCRAVGEALHEIMTAHPENRLTVLAGHTHCPRECQVLPNLRVIVGGAEYAQPRLQRVLLVQ